MFLLPFFALTLSNIKTNNNFDTFDLCIKETNSNKEKFLQDTHDQAYVYVDTVGRLKQA